MFLNSPHYKAIFLIYKGVKERKQPVFCFVFIFKQNPRLHNKGLTLIESAPPRVPYHIADEGVKDPLHRADVSETFSIRGRAVHHDGFSETSSTGNGSTKRY